jgi:hypothetical protein
MRPRTIALLVTAALAVTMAGLGQWLWLLLTDGGGIGFGLAFAILALMFLGVRVAVVNLRFGVHVERLARRLADEGGLPDTSALPRRPSGRIEPAAAAAWFDERKAELDVEPTDWRRWYRLAQAYDLAGDRRRAWETMRQALRLSARNGDGSAATSAAQGPVTRPAG